MISRFSLKFYEFSQVVVDLILIM